MKQLNYLAYIFELSMKALEKKQVGKFVGLRHKEREREKLREVQWTSGSWNR